MSYGDSPEMLDYIDHLEAENERLRAENAKLKAQLTWLPVTEKPEISDKYYVIRKGFAITFRDICLFMDGEWCVNRVSEEHGGEYWQPIEKDNTCPVVLWFPAPIIPPAPEKV